SLYIIIPYTTLFRSNKTESSNTNVEDSSAEKISYAAWMADSEMKRTPDPQYLDFRDKPKWEYTNGLICSAMMEVYDDTGEKRYFNYAKSYADTMINESGEIKTYKKSIYNIDRMNPGKFLIDLYEASGTELHTVGVDELRVKMREHPRISVGGFWHEKGYSHQMS